MSEETFDELQQILDDRDISLPSAFREYVDLLVAHRGNVETVSGETTELQTSAHSEFPFRVEVSKNKIRECERLKLECDHLREQLDAYQSSIQRLELELEERDDEYDDRVFLEDIDSATHSPENNES